MIPILNQPVNFQTDPFDNPYVEDIKYKQLVQQGDITNFQFYLTNGVNTQNVLINSTFSENLDGWVQPSSSLYDEFIWFDGTLKYDANANPLLNNQPKTCRIFQQSLINGQQYSVQIKINQSFNGTLEVYLGDNKIAQLTAGTYNVGGFCSSGNTMGNLELRWIPTPTVSGNLSSSKVVIDYVYATFINTRNTKFQIVDTSDNSIVDTLAVVPNPLTAPTTFATNIEIVDNYMTVFLDWQDRGISDGCYRIKVIDSEVNTNLQCGCNNGEFNGILNKTGTIILPAWDVTRSTDTVFVEGVFGNQIAFTGNGTATLTQSGLKVGVTYNYQFQIEYINSAVVNIKAGTATATFTTTGTKTGSLICTTNGNLIIEFIGNAGSDGARISYIRTEAITADLEVDYQSNPFTLQASQFRTVLINCNNTENVYGFNYERTLFNPTLRLRGYLAAPENPYDIERLTTENTDGTREVIYNKRRKRRLLIVENEPEFIHDWLSLLAGHDHVMINNREVFITNDDYPSIAWGRFRVLGSTEIEFGFKTELKRKVVTGKIGTPYFIEDADGDGLTDGVMGSPLLNNGGATQVDSFSQLTDPSDSNVVIRGLQSTQTNNF